jgi:hypothetical protein
MMRGSCAPDLAERIIVQRSIRIARPETVRQVVRFHTEFHALAFGDLEYTRQRRIQPPIA